jgi:hypothetical protein
VEKGGWGVSKRNLTVQLDEDVIRRAKVLADDRSTSVSRLVARRSTAWWGRTLPTARRVTGPASGCRRASTSTAARTPPGTSSMTAEAVVFVDTAVIVKNPLEDVADGA